MTLQQKNLVLPQEAVDYFDILGQDDRNVYMKALRGRGWTLQSLASVAGVSRERVRQIVAAEWPLGVLEDNAPLPSPPERPEPVRSPRVQVEPSEETLSRLRELQPFAQKVAGNSPKYRKEAKEFVQLLHHAHSVEGVTYYHLAQLLGVTHSAIRSRLIRYRYITPTHAKGSTTRAYKTIREENLG